VKISSTVDDLEAFVNVSTSAANETNSTLFRMQ